MEQPWLSVVMPIYNGENYLEQALRSILDQEDDRIEVIALEGGSTDRTADILNTYAHWLPLRLFVCPHFKNWVARTNHGLSHARGDFVCFLHHDDLWLEGRLDVLRSLVRKAPGATMFLHPSWFIGPQGNRVGSWCCPLPHDVEIEPEVMIERLLVQNFISMPAPVFSRVAVLKVGGLDEGLWYTADWDFWLKLAAAGKTYYHPRPLSAFRIHPQAQTMQGSADIQDFRKQLETVLSRHLDTCQSTDVSRRIAQRVARFSIDVNTYLASFIHGRESSVLRLLPKFLSLGPVGWHRYLRDSRIVERTLPRYRIGLAKPQLLAGRQTA